MTRRSLLAMLAAAATDPERLLWTPGKKLISIPPPTQATFVHPVIRVISTYEVANDRFIRRLDILYGPRVRA